MTTAEKVLAILGVLFVLGLATYITWYHFGPSKPNAGEPKGFFRWLRDLYDLL